MRRTIWMAAIVIAALALAACGDDDAGTTTTAATATTEAPATTVADTGDDTTGGEEYPASFVESYMDGCTSEATQEQCQCTIDAFQERYTLDEFLGFVAAEDATTDPRVEEIIALCAR